MPPRQRRRRFRLARNPRLLLRATQIGLTATPKETKEVSNIHYFGEPVYTYSLRQGIDDGFLAPYKVVRIDLDKDSKAGAPKRGQTDKHGKLIEDRIYNQKDFDRTLVLEKRTELVARKITEFLKATDPYAKTIVFCEDIDHAERMRQALVNLNPERVAENRKYVMRITGDEQEGKAELDNFINPESRYPVIATTSKLMTTGVDAQTCKLIVLDQRIQSMTEFKQIIGRGTRINEDYDKYWFTIMDFKKATELFADPAFDGDPVQIFEPKGDEPPVPPELGKEVEPFERFEPIDPFDLICHVAFDRPPLSRRERAAQIRKRDVFSKYGEQARAVLNGLLDKYADAGIEDLENIGILTLDPFNRLGTPHELVRAFGGKPAYLKAVHELEQQLYG
jgi:type I site-specific restriction endonuclease